MPFQRCGAGQQLVERNAQRIDIGACVDVEIIMLGLFGAHVEWRADHDTVAGVQRLFGERMM